MEGLILNTDCLLMLKAMPDGCVDMCLCSPPYWRLRDYEVEGQLGWEATPEDFVTSLCDVFDQLKRVLKPTGSLWVNIGDTYGNRKNGMPANSLCQIPSRFGIEMTNRGWLLPSEIIWHKPKCTPSPVKDRFTVDFEKLFVFAKAPDYYFEQQLEPLAAASVKRAKYGWNCDKANNGKGVHVKTMGNRFCNPKGRNMRTVWSINPTGFKGDHSATYPEQLCEIPIKAGSPVGGVVLDIFAGSGTTLVVAKKLGRKYLGCELNPDYCRMIKERLKGNAPVPQSPLNNGEISAMVA